MAGLPTVVVRLDDGTGTFPYDISPYVDLSRGITITRGRGDELSQVEPSTLSLTLDNNDGRFTYGATTYATGIFVDQMIRVTETVGATTSHRFTGYVQNWPTSWPSGGDNYSQVTVSAVDRLARLARRNLRSATEQEVLADSPYAFYQFSEPDGSTSAADASGNARPVLTVVPSTTAPQFGSDAPNTFDGLSGVVLANGGGYVTGGPALVTSGTSITVRATVRAPTSGSTAIWQLQTSDWTTGQPRVALFVQGSGFGAYDGNGLRVSTGPVYGDGLWHDVTIVVTGTSYALFVDGISYGTGTGLSIPSGTDLWFSGSSPTATYSLAHFATYNTALSAGRITSQANAVLSGFAAERSDQRIARLATYANIAAGAMALETGYQTAVPAQTLSGRSVSDAMQDLVTSESGLLFVRGDGALIFHNKGHRAAQTSADTTLTTNDIGPDTAFSVDMQNVSNYVTSKGTSGVEQVAQNTTSIAQHEQYPTTLDLLVSTDEEALQAANWLVTASSQPQPRLPNVTLDLLSQTSAFQQAVLSLDISDRLAITGLPAQTPGGTSADLLIEGWTESITADSWSLALNTSNFAAAWAWVLDHATYSVLGTTTRPR